MNLAAKVAPRVRAAISASYTSAWPPSPSFLLDTSWSLL